MLKTAKLYALLLVIVASTIIGMFGVSGTALAQEVAWELGDDMTLNYDIDGDGEKELFQRYDVVYGANPELSQTNLPQDLGVSNPEWVYVYQESPPSHANHIIYFNEDPASATSANYVKYGNYTPAPAVGGGSPTYSEMDEASKKTITTDAPPGSETPGEDTEPKDAPSNCKIDSIGWLICPLLRFMAEVTDRSYSLLEGTLLRVEPLPLTENAAGDADGANIFSAWKKMRDLANIVFIVGFLIIVFSQLTSLGIGNYGIKRLLPKIIVAAVLVNLSYYICAIAVDISNILGSVLKNALVSLEFTRLNDESGGGIEATINGTAPNSFVTIVDTALISVAIYALLPVLLPMLIGVTVAIITVVITLTIRQALIILLIAISPLAFVALLLPNTEDYFKKWRSLFTVMLMIYPAISLIFGASALASNIIITSAPDDQLVQLIGAGVAILPLFITPIVMKVSGGVLNRFAGIVNDPSKGFFDNKRRALEEKGQIMKAGRAERTARFVDKSSRGSKVFGAAGSKRRRALTWGTNYGANTRERARKDELDKAEKTMEETYLGSQKGQETRNAAKNAQQSLHDAEIHAETVRLSSPEGIQLAQGTMLAEMKKQTAENKAQRLAMDSIPAAVAAANRMSEANKDSADNNMKSRGLSAVTSDAAGRAALAAQKASEINKNTVENRAETGAFNSLSAATMEASKAAEIQKQTAETNAKTSGLSSLAGSPAGQSMLGQAKDSELRNQIAENDAKAIGQERATSELKIQAATSAQDLSNTENSDKQMIEEISAVGDAHPDLTSLGVSASTATAARDSRFDSKATANAIGNAAREGEIQYAKEINRVGSTLADQAGGRVNPKGASDARANATAVEIKAFNEAVDNEKKTMSKIPPTSIVGGPAGLETIMDDKSLSVERRTAATGMRAKTGGMGDILETFNKLGRDMDAAERAGNTAEVEALSSMQQQFMEDVGSKLPASVTGPAKGAMAGGRFRGSLDTEILNSLKDGRYSGEVLAGLHPKELAMIKDVLAANKGTASFTPDHDTQLGILQTKITEYKEAAPDLGRGLAQEREIPITDIEKL